MKIVYVLVSSDKDFYYEQAVVSIYSLKKWMPESFVTLVVDEKTKLNLTNKAALLEQFDEILIVHFPENITAMQRSRSIKTSLRTLLKGDFLYVDVDTIWCAPLDEKDFTSDVMGVPDSHTKYAVLLKESFDPLMETLNFNRNFEYFCNGGVFFMKDSPIAYQFSRRWNELWKYCCDKGVFTDQQSLNQTNYEMNNIIQYLPGYYNVQISYSIRYLANAKIIHYFSNIISKKDASLFDTYYFKRKDVFESIRQNGITKDIETAVRNAKEAFSESTILLNDIVFRKKAKEHADHASYGFIDTLVKSKKIWSQKVLTILDYAAAKIIQLYNKINS